MTCSWCHHDLEVPTELQQRVLRGRQLVAVTLGGAVPGSAVPQLREVFFEIDPQGYATP